MRCLEWREVSNVDCRSDGQPRTPEQGVLASINLHRSGPSGLQGRRGSRQEELDG